MKKKIDKNHLFGIVNRLGMKLTILTLLIILGADILTFTAAIVIGFVTG